MTFVDASGLVKRYVREQHSMKVRRLVEFTEHGGVDVRVRLLRATATRMDLQFTVRDTGIGIPHDRRTEAGPLRAYRGRQRRCHNDARWPADWSRCA